jgi:outer membrane lipoprotein-sorting protein
MSRGTATTRQVLVGACLVVLVVGVLLVGVWSSVSPAENATQQIGANASERYATIEGLNATRTTINREGDEVRRSVLRVSMRPGTDRFRRELLSGQHRRHDLTVSNGSMMWWRNRSSGAVERLRLSNPTESADSQGERIERLFSRLNVTGETDRTAATPTPGIDPLPAVPQNGGAPDGQATGDLDEIGAAAFAVSYNGTDTLDGRTVYVLEITARNDSRVGGYRQTLWVDAERFFPLKRHTEWRADGERHALTVRYENVTFDPGLDESTFRFDPDANVSVEREDTPRRDFYASTPALRRTTNISVPEPDLPPTFRLAYASRTESQRLTGIGLKYVNASMEISVSKNRGYFYPPTPDWSTQVAGHQVNVSTGYTNYASWECGEYDYQVSGHAVPPELLVEIAGSVGCE